MKILAIRVFAFAFSSIRGPVGWWQMKAAAFQFVWQLAVIVLVWIGVGRFLNHRSWNEVQIGIVAIAAVLLARHFLLPWMNREEREATKSINGRKFNSNLGATEKWVPPKKEKSRN
jgi:low affinity Fe/Cu permease